MSADSPCIRWVIVILVGSAGLLLGGVVTGVIAAVVGQVALGLTRSAQLHR
jgi:hypothetical protein